MDLSTLTLFFTEYGAVAIFVIVFLEYLNLPGFPAGVIMPLVGMMAAERCHRSVCGSTYRQAEAQ